MRVVTIEDVLAFLNREQIPYQYSGSMTAAVAGFSSLGNYRPGTVTWLKSEKNAESHPDWAGVALLVVQEGIEAGTDAPNRIVCSESKRAFFQILEHFYGETEQAPGVGQGTYLSPQVVLGKDVRIGCNCVLDGEIVVGDGTAIHHNVTILHRTEIGKHCDIQSGTVIGHDGFAYTEDASRKKTMVRHYGGVTIEDHVYIGPNVVIDRGTIDNTVIGRDTKIDGLCFIAHNVQIGEGCTLITGSKLYGSSRLLENAYVASGIVRNQCCVGREAFVGMGAVVTKDVPDGVTVAGNPARELKK